MSTLLPFVALTLTYSLADRFAGGGWPWLDDKLPGRAALWGAVLCWIVTRLVFLRDAEAFFTASIFPAIWLAYRTPPWKLFGGSMTPYSLREIAGTWVRHLIPCALALVACFWLPLIPAVVALVFVVYAIGATTLAVWMADEVLRARKAGGKYGAETSAHVAKRCNNAVELIRGALFGLAVAVVLS